MKPVNGQVIDDSSQLDSLLDTKGKNLKFKQQDDCPEGDMVFVAKGSDGRTYSAQLARKNLLVSIYDTPKEKVEKKAIEDRGAKLVQGEKVTGDNRDAEKIQEPVKENSKDKKQLDKLVAELDDPFLKKEQKENQEKDKESKNKNTSKK